MSFVSSSTQPSNKSLQEPELSKLYIKKPSILSESCPVETTTRCLPLIEEKPRKKKEVTKTKRSSEPEEHWLKSGISLPKLQSKHVLRSIPTRSGGPIETLKSIDFNSVALLNDTNDVSFTRSHEDALSKLLNCYKGAVETLENAQVSSHAVGPSSSKSEFRVPSSELNFDDFKVEEEKLEESHALRRWEHWLKESRELQESLSKRLGRKKCELQFQKAQNYRTMMEDKSLLFLAQIPLADKWRGHPFFWRSALEMGGSESEEFAPKYYGVQTRLEKGEMPDMEFIGIPTVIKKEKGLICDGAPNGVSLDPKWEKLPYRKDRLRDLWKEIKLLKSSSIEMNELEIVGTKIPREQEAKVAAPVGLENLPKIQVYQGQHDDSCSIDFYPDRSAISCLLIGDREVEYDLGNDYCQNLKTDCADIAWEIDFGVNAIGVLVERSLRVENKGRVAVKYELLPEKLDGTNTNFMQLKQHEPWFFFDKNAGIFLPGQILYLKFYHYTKRSGIRKEFWSLKTKPPLSKNRESGTIVLRAVSTEESSDSSIEALDSYLGKRVTRSIVDFLLQILISKALSPSEGLPGIEYRSLFFEKELFEYQNPKHYYHSVIVKELRRIFEQIPDKRQREWDLSLASLIELIVTYVKGKEQDSLLREISNNAKKLFRPNRLWVRNIKKYRMTYGILCKMTNFMEEDHDYLMSCFIKSKEEARRTSSEYGEVDEECNDFSPKSEEDGVPEECGADIPEVLLEMQPTDFLYFQAMFYLKVYRRVAEAIEHIVGALETSKLSDPWREINPKFTRPSRQGRE